MRSGVADGVVGRFVNRHIRFVGGDTAVSGGRLNEPAADRRSGLPLLHHPRHGAAPGACGPRPGAGQRRIGRRHVRLGARPVKGRALNIRNAGHWHDLRAGHVGGSEVPALFGEHPQLTRYELHLIKSGLIPAPELEDVERIWWGKRLEPVIADGVAHQTGWHIRKIHRYWTARPGLALGGTPDYEIMGKVVPAGFSGPGILELKAVDRLIVSRRWDDGTPPLGHLLQLQTYLGLTGRSWGAIGALVGGNELRVSVYARMPAVVGIIEREVAG